MLLTFYTCLIITALSLGFLALLMWQAAGDETKRRAIPVRQTIAGLIALTAAALLTGFTVTNVQANNEALDNRARTASAQIASFQALIAYDPTTAAGDITAGSTDLTEPEALSDLAAGRKVTLATKSGKEASIQLFTNGRDVLPVITYDGKEDKDIARPFKDKVVNDSGYPQLIPLLALETRE